MSLRGKSSGKGFLLKLILAALAALAASAVVKKKVLAPAAPATDYRLPSTPPANPSAAMGPEDSTPLTEQEKISLKGVADLSSAASATSTEAATAVDEAIAGDTGTASETPAAETTDASAMDVTATGSDEAVTSDTGAASETPAAETIDTLAMEYTEDESKSELELLEGFDATELQGAEEDDTSAPMGIAAEPPTDALASGKGFVYPGKDAHDCPEDFPIKGNASSRIFHRPGESSYDLTIPEICFVSDDAAEAMGYRERKR